MSSTPANDDETDAGDDQPPASLPARARCAVLETADGTVVIYARDNHRAWIESDTTTSTDAMA